MCKYYCYSRKESDLESVPILHCVKSKQRGDATKYDNLDSSSERVTCTGIKHGKDTVKTENGNIPVVDYSGMNELNPPYNPHLDEKFQNYKRCCLWKLLCCISKSSKKSAKYKRMLENPHGSYMEEYNKAFNSINRNFDRDSDYKYFLSSKDERVNVLASEININTKMGPHLNDIEEKNIAHVANYVVVTNEGKYKNVKKENIKSQKSHNDKGDKTIAFLETPIDIYAQNKNEERKQENQLSVPNHTNKNKKNRNVASRNNRQGSKSCENSTITYLSPQKQMLNEALNQQKYLFPNVTGTLLSVGDSDVLCQDSPSTYDTAKRDDELLKKMKQSMNQENDPDRCAKAKTDYLSLGILKKSGDRYNVPERGSNLKKSVLKHKENVDLTHEASPAKSLTPEKENANIPIIESHSETEKVSTSSTTRSAAHIPVLNYRESLHKESPNASTFSNKEVPNINSLSKGNESVNKVYDSNTLSNTKKESFTNTTLNSKSGSANKTPQNFSISSIKEENARISTLNSKSGSVNKTPQNFSIKEENAHIPTLNPRNDSVNKVCESNKRESANIPILDSRKGSSSVNKTSQNISISSNKRESIPTLDSRDDSLNKIYDKMSISSSKRESAIPTLNTGDKSCKIVSAKESDKNGKSVPVVCDGNDTLNAAERDGDHKRSSSKWSNNSIHKSSELLYHFHLPLSSGPIT